jgi:hypothetical protein
MTEDLTREHFSGHIGEMFHVAAGEHTFALKLVEAAPGAKSLRPGGAFSLVFIGPPAPVLPQASYPMRHDALGRIGIFIVPVGPRDGGMSYEAVFN